MMCLMGSGSGNKSFEREDDGNVIWKMFRTRVLTEMSTNFRACYAGKWITVI